MLLLPANWINLLIILFNFLNLIIVLNVFNQKNGKKCNILQYITHVSVFLSLTNCLMFNIMIFDSNVTTKVLGTVNLILNSHISSVFISNKQLIIDFIHLFLSEYYNHACSSDALRLPIHNNVGNWSLKMPHDLFFIVFLNLYHFSSQGQYSRRFFKHD